MDLNRSSCMVTVARTQEHACLLSQAALSQRIKMALGGSSDSVGLKALVMEVRTRTDFVLQHQHL